MASRTSTGDEGKLIDGTTRSAEWRAAAARSAATGTDGEASHSEATGEDSRYTPPTSFKGSVMIPAELAFGSAGSEQEQSGSTDGSGTASDPYIEA